VWIELKIITFHENMLHVMKKNLMNGMDYLLVFRFSNVKKKTHGSSSH
jgi:hypothetical protein